MFGLTRRTGQSLEMKNIMDALVALDPANEYYEENFNTYSQELDILHGEF